MQRNPSQRTSPSEAAALAVAGMWVTADREIRDGVLSHEHLVLYRDGIDRAVTR